MTQSFKFLGKQPPKQEWGVGNYWSGRSKFFEGALREAANALEGLSFKLLENEFRRANYLHEHPEDNEETVGDSVQRVCAFGVKKTGDYADYVKDIREKMRVSLSEVEGK